ncbi:MAG: hypoxanthine phosphoribosyltransferase [Candidatus Caenarcaniphilales bacterium]|nr:hypoxanthine phosphoribosyltransferase [Candidatus Caenarcaniphilales bacterium]
MPNPPSTPNPLISNSQIITRVSELAREIDAFYVDHPVAEIQPLVLICVLKGAVLFTSDLIRELKTPFQLEFVRLSSYGSNTISSGMVEAPDLSLPNLFGRNILVVEDIIDTGRTANFLKAYLIDQFKPSSLKFVCLLDKASRREIPFDPDFVGFEIEDRFVIGYGLDYDEKYRGLNYIGVLYES